ncbi:MAG: SIS domain-containing protein [Planctomycetes bacterium]|nr:SIS domain-containing protein [Planctomycetota bacterium]
MKDQIAEHIRVVSAIAGQIPLLERIASRLIECFEAGGRLYLCGNGGSAADTQHIAAELVGRFMRDHRPLPAIALTTDTSILTAVSNDFDFARTFSRQVEAHIASRDVLWALSVSGRSKNIINALEASRHIGACNIGFTGRSGGEMPGLSDLCLRVDHENSDRVQETHQLAYHLICERIEAHFAC